MSWLIVVVLIAVFGSSFEREVKTLSISSANNHFAIQLLQQLYADNGNVFVSPFSISTAFAMLYLGANNSTADELREALGYNFGHLTRDDVNQQFERVLREMSDIDSTKYQLNAANKLVVQKNFSILTTFKDNLRKYYQAVIDSADFAGNAVGVMNDINAWVKQQTHDKIDKLLSQPLSADTRLVLLDAIYFKGNWQTMFMKNETVKEMFYNRGDPSFLAVETMRRSGKFNYTEIAALDSKLLELPYSGDDVSMYILLPNERKGFSKIKEGLKNFETIENAIRNLSEETVDVSIPKFKLEESRSLKKQLTDLGMKQVFTNGADLSGIDGNRDLDVSDVIHKAVVEVNEEGSEAAAATAVVITIKAIPLNPKQNLTFNADHPFLFFIRDNRNGMILFAGHVNNLLFSVSNQ